MNKQEIQNRIEALKASKANRSMPFEHEIIAKVESDLDIIDMDSRYDAMLNDIYDTVKIGYYSFDPSRILAELDPIAYRCGFSDFTDSEESGSRIVEVKGNYYDYDAVEEIKEEITSELESELEALEADLKEIEANEVEG